MTDSSPRAILVSIEEGGLSRALPQPIANSWVDRALLGVSVKTRI